MIGLQLLLAGVWVAPTEPPVVVTPAVVVVGEANRVAVQVTAPGARAADLQLVVEAGRAGPLVAEGDGDFRGTWALPLDPTPRRFAVAVIDLGTGRSSFATVAVARRAVFDTHTQPGARVRLLLDGTIASEEEAGEDGRVTLSTLVAAGSTGAVRIEHWLGKRLIHDEALTLGVGDERRTFVVRSPGRGAAEVVFTYWDSGRPLLDNGPGHEGTGQPVARTPTSRPVATTPGRGAGAPASTVSAPALGFSTAEEERQPEASARRPLGPALFLLGGTAIDMAGGPAAVGHFGATFQPAAFPHWLSLVADVGVQHWWAEPDRKRSVTWTVPLEVGGRATWEPAPAWRLTGGLGGGLALFAFDRVTTTDRAKAPKSGGWDVAGLAALWAEMGYGWGPGSLVLALRLGSTVATLSGTAGPLLSEVLIGYRWRWDSWANSPN